MGFIELIELDVDTPESLPTLGLYRFGLYCTQIAFAFLTFCIVIPVITIQGKYDVSSFFLLIDKINKSIKLHLKIRVLAWPHLIIHL